MQGSEIGEADSAWRRVTETLWENFPRGDYFHHSTPIEGDVEKIAEKIQELGLEGIVAKKMDSVYTPGKISGAWVKRKLKQSDEFVVASCGVQAVAEK